MRQVRTPSYQYENLNEIDELLKCPICTNPLEEPVMHINCGYTFCNKCIEGKSNCPSCNDSNLTVCKAPRNIIVQLDNLKVVCPQCKTGVKRGEYKQHLQESCPLGKACQDLQNKEQLLELNYKKKVLELELNYKKKVSNLENENKLFVEKTTVELQNKYNELFNDLKKEREEFEMNRNCFVKLENSVKPIQLNVGGKLMTVGLGLFLNNHIENGSVLKEMFTGQYPLFKTTTTGESNLDNNVYFIDCNPDLFKIILDWLRYGKLAQSVLDKYGDQLLIVADYFKLNNLLKYLNNNFNKENEVKNENDIVKFNIGGKPFYFLKETICFRMKNPNYGIDKEVKDEYYESTLLESLVSGNIPVTLIDNNYIYIDRDPTYFHYIANYLRNAGNQEDFELPKDEEDLRKLLTEVRYYGIQALIDLNDGNIGKCSFFKDSLIFNNGNYKYQVLLNRWTNGDKNQQWQLIYRGSRDGLKAQDFHKLCDGKSPTITIVKSTSGHIFGGFTTTAWNQSDQSYSSPNSFLFSLYNPTKQDSKPMRFELNSKNADCAIYCYSYYGPTFGNGHDLCISNSYNSGNGRSKLGETYGNNVSYVDLTGTQQFTVEEIEVFTKI